MISAKEAKEKSRTSDVFGDAWEIAEEIFSDEIEKAIDAYNFGIILGTLGRQGNT